jgi:hypothetical protein
LAVFETVPQEDEKRVFFADEFGFSAQFKQIASSISPLLMHIFNLSLTHGVFPELSKNKNFIALPKAGISTDASNYRGISLLPVFSKFIFGKLLIDNYKDIY